MSRDELIESVERLREQVAKLDAHEATERLDRILTDLEQQLDDPENEDRHGNLVENLGEAVGHFEVEHPRLTAALNRVMVTLSNIGM